MAPKDKHTDDADSGKKGFKIALWISGVVLAFVVVYVVFFFLMARAPRDGRLVIPEGATGKNLVDSLRSKFGDDYTGKVMTLVAIGEEDPIRPGNYEIAKGTTVFTLAKRIRNHRQDPIRLVIQGQRGIGPLSERIADKLGIPADSVVAALTAEGTERGLTAEQTPGLCIDATYDFYYGTSATDAVKKIVANYDHIWTRERKQKAAKIGLTPAEVMVIASIIDEETNHAPEKGTMARVYINRLAKGMKLQADPTARFAAGDFTIKRVTKRETSVDSPYNTYKYEGLPPGPIRTTSQQTIDAILNSEPNDYLFFCAKEDFSGTHNFSKDYATHEANARRYQQALNERGIK